MVSLTSLDACSFSESGHLESFKYRVTIIARLLIRFRDLAVEFLGPDRLHVRIGAVSGSCDKRYPLGLSPYTLTDRPQPQARVRSKFIGKATFC